MEFLGRFSLAIAGTQLEVITEALQQWEGKGTSTARRGIPRSAVESALP